ncbi:MAG: DUF255 domain-containing protein, partial [Armatimonadetes bacterium]|nr:DUF255 domain-containing protein [Armatimonadota bacterium]
ARKEGKPIFLSVGYAACHWCHVMERESFEDEGVARLLNDHFISIKVDREERPDVDEVYMTAVQILTGSGGWPLSVFLRPDGQPFFGGTYYPRQAFAELLQKIHETWTDPEKQKQVDAAVNDLGRLLGRAAVRPPQPGSLTPAVLTAAVRELLRSFDPEDGGFGGAPKFPPSTRLAFLLSQYRKKPEPAIRKVLTLTLDRMARGGLYDQIGGGFHRYSTDARWLVPHFEKMLYDNALLASVYLEASRVLDRPYYRRIGVETLEFMLREFRDPAGAFWSSLDADSLTAAGEREEGRFYVWSPAQVEAVLGKADAAFFNQTYDVTPAGNWESLSIPNLIARTPEAVATARKQTPEVVWRRLDSLRTRLRIAREKRPRPARDDKILADWNGLALRALVAGYDATGDERYRRAAEQTADFLLTRMRSPDGPRRGRLYHSYRANRALPVAFLDDYAFLAVGLLDLHRITQVERWRSAAQELMTVLRSDFWDEQRGSFYTTPQGHETLPARMIQAHEGAVPSGLAMATLAGIRLARLNGDGDLRAVSARLLDAYSSDMRRYPGAHAGLLLAAHTQFYPEAEETGGPPDRSVVTATVVSVSGATRPGLPRTIVVRLRIRSGWHVNSNRPRGDDLIPTRFEVLPPFSLVAARFPPPKEVAFQFAGKSLLVHEGDNLVRLQVKGPARASRSQEVRLRLRFQGCSDRMCLLPTSVLLRARVPDP